MHHHILKHFVLYNEITRCGNSRPYSYVCVIIYIIFVFSDTCPSPLVALIKAGLFKAATSLITCGYQLHKDVQFENFDLSLNNSASYVCGGVEYQRVNYEDDLKLLQTAIHSFDGIPPLAYIRRIKIREKLLFCTRGAEIESKIKSLPLPITLRAFLSCRDDTFEKDTIHILERFVSENLIDILNIRLFRSLILCMNIVICNIFFVQN